MDPNFWFPVIAGIVAAGLGTSWLWVSSRSSLFAFQSDEIEKGRKRMDEMQEEIDDLHNRDRRREEELLELRLDLTELHRGVEVLLEQLAEKAITPKWIPKWRKPRRGGLRDSLAHRLEELFSVEELNSLAYDLEITPDQIPGDTISSRAIGLVEMCYRQGLLVQLEEAIDKLRPLSSG